MLNSRIGEDSGRVNSGEAVLGPSQGGEEGNRLVKGEDFATSGGGGVSEIDMQYKCT